MTQVDVMKILARSENPLTAKEVYERLSARRDVTKSSVMSSLSKLENLNDASVTLKRPPGAKQKTKAYVLSPKLKEIYRKKRW